MRANWSIFAQYFILVLGLTCMLDTVDGEAKKKSGSSSKKMSNAKKIGLGLAAGAAGAAGTAYIGHKLKKKSKKLRKGFGDDDDRLACWVCGIPGFRMCPQGEPILYRARNTTDDNSDDEDFPGRRHRLPDDGDSDDDDELYDAYYGTYTLCPDHADSCLTLYSDHSREKVLMRNCYDEGLFGCYDTIQGLSGFACFCRHDLCNNAVSIRWSLGLLLVLGIHFFVQF